MDSQKVVTTKSELEIELELSNKLSFLKVNIYKEPNVLHFKVTTSNKKIISIIDDFIKWRIISTPNSG